MDLLTPLIAKVEALEKSFEEKIEKQIAEIESPFTTVIAALENRVAQLEAKAEGKLEGK